VVESRTTITAPPKPTTSDKVGAGQGVTTPTLSSVTPVVECGVTKQICPFEAECLLTAIGYRCECRTGYEGNGIICAGMLTF